MSPQALAQAPRSELASALATAPPADPARLAGWRFLGLSLGLPAWVDRLAWSIFEKDFVATDSGVRGWNVRLEQELWRPDLRPTAMQRKGAPFSFGHFAVRRDPDGTILDYGLGDNPALDPTRLVRDPLVALDPEQHWLLGQSRVQLGPLDLATPSYFLLHRMGPVEHLA